MKKQADYEKFIADLHRRQLEKRESGFLKMHLTNRTIITRHVNAFMQYLPYVKTGNVLDWGCKHAFDACLIKHHFNDEVKMFGCDIPEEPYELFHEYAGLEFAEIEHPFRLPYEDNTFDTVISSGALEHVPNDFESLKEIYRILKPEGRFIVTFLPNRYSYTEALSRLLKRSNHMRRYTMCLIENMLLHTGFVPLYKAYHQFFPSLAGGESMRLGEIEIINSSIQFLYRYNGFFEKLWPLNKLSANIMVAGEKKAFIG